MISKINSFNLRVYALIIADDKILLSKELINNQMVLKFPGGGVEFGEGLVDALQRESKEEIGQQLKNLTHFYTTDFFQQSTFDKSEQLISIYYKAELTQMLKNKVDKPIKDQPVFEWKSINNMKNSDLHFPIDKLVLKKIKSLQ